MGVDEEAGVEWTEARRQEELAHACDVGVHSGCVPVRTFLGEILLADQTPSFRLDQSGGLRRSHAVWRLVSCRNEWYEASP